MVLIAIAIVQKKFHQKEKPKCVVIGFACWR